MTQFFSSKLNLTLPLAIVSAISLSTQAEAALTPYTSAGQNVVYSSVSDVTWTGNANLLGTMINSQGFDTVVNAIIAASPIIYDKPNYYDGSYNNYDGDNGRLFSGQYTVSASDFTRPNFARRQGQANWFGAKAFINYLNSINYAGSNQWALPTASVNINPAVGQFGELYYNELGGSAGSSIPDTSNFSNEQSSVYWLSNELMLSALGGYDSAYAYSTSDGSKGYNEKRSGRYIWAITPGNLTAVPLPGAFWLFSGGLLGLFGLKRQRRA